MITTISRKTILIVDARSYAAKICQQGEGRWLLNTQVMTTWPWKKGIVDILNNSHKLPSQDGTKLSKTYNLQCRCENNGLYSKTDMQVMLVIITKKIEFQINISSLGRQNLISQKKKKLCSGEPKILVMAALFTITNGTAFYLPCHNGTGLYLYQIEICNLDCRTKVYVWNQTNIKSTSFLNPAIW